MKYSVGYYEEDEFEQPFARSIAHYRRALAEVYFPWLGLRTCRAELTHENRKTHLIEGLCAARDAGASLCLLINANCYGSESLSIHFSEQIVAAITELGVKQLLPNSVTTTSLFAAHVVKKSFPDIEVRASVNMRLGTWWQMEKLFNLFDGFYLRREFNYRLKYIEELKAKLQSADKRLYLLANSGCMSFCPGQVFHDNLVAHEEEIKNKDNTLDMEPYVCWKHYRRQENHPALLKNTWIRPEDTGRYEGIVDSMKLATRNHARPVQVITAYMAGHYDGNPLDLTEPSHSSLLFPNTIDNTRFPADWFEMKERCNHDCDACGYCDRVWKTVLKSY